MAYIECSNGHIFDSDMYTQCPYCQGGGSQVMFGSGKSFSGDASNWVSENNNAAASNWAAPSDNVASQPQNVNYGYSRGPEDDSVIGKTAPVGMDFADSGVGKTVAPMSMFQDFDDSSSVGKTTPIMMEDAGSNAGNVTNEANVKRNIVGWLVCIDGADQGKDYKVFSGDNKIGRGSNMDITIKSDVTMSRNNHATIEYDEDNNVFYLVPGSSANVVLLDDVEISEKTSLKSHQVIDLGRTKLLFISLCNERFEWKDWMI